MFSRLLNTSAPSSVGCLLTFAAFLPYAQLWDADNNLAMWRALLLVAALAALQIAYASSGDRAQIFVDCVSSCHAQRCTNSFAALPLALRLTRWTCTDDCKYQCMHLITDDAVATGARIHQYYGKWPFWRLAGMQEPASVAFSLLNMFFHVKGALEIQRRIPSVHPMKPYYLVFSLVSVNAWIWSSVFHTRGLLSLTS
jgi:post-GPI attachment to proteins factor 3